MNVNNYNTGGENLKRLKEGMIARLKIIYRYN